VLYPVDPSSSRAWLLAPELIIRPDAVALPVNVGLAIGALRAILLLTVVENAASSPRAAANSLRVFSAAGEESTSAARFASASALVYAESIGS